MVAVLATHALPYPLLAAAFVHAYPNAPTFSVPCPTTLFIAGLLVFATPRRRRLLIIPPLWSVIGTSAAVPLGVTTDVALVAAG